MEKEEIKARARATGATGPLLDALLNLIEHAVTLAPQILADIEALIAALTPFRPPVPPTPTP